MAGEWGVHGGKRGPLKNYFMPLAGTAPEYPLGSVQNRGNCMFICPQLSGTSALDLPGKQP
ncbi:hypothetical protein AX27061_5741 [Achromobacter xylosoxidans NBRC 15126 = ATCC 27061]|nr:hypothetical protein AX27061_5741 [Achromobacter xylosoxidans NBRC 15126 = ATCC 27061]